MACEILFAEIHRMWIADKFILPVSKNVQDLDFLKKIILDDNLNFPIVTCQYSVNEYGHFLYKVVSESSWLYSLSKLIDELDRGDNNDMEILRKLWSKDILVEKLVDLDFESCVKFERKRKSLK